MVNYDPVNPLPLTDNAEAYVRNLCNVEHQFMATPDYSDDQDKAQLRAQAMITIKKLKKESDYFALTPYLAVNYFNRYLSRKQLTLPMIEENEDQNLELLAFCCFSLAWKMQYDESRLREVLNMRETWVFQSDKIMKMEIEILNALQWQMRSVTSIAFIRFFNPRGQKKGLSVSSTAIAQVVMETYEEMGFTRFKPSQIAVAVILNSVANIRMVDNDYINLAAVEECLELMKEKLESKGKAMNETREKWKKKADAVLKLQKRSSSKTDVDASSSRYARAREERKRKFTRFQSELGTIKEEEEGREIAEEGETGAGEREREERETEEEERKGEEERETDAEEREGEERETELSIFRRTTFLEQITACICTPLTSRCNIL